MNVLEVERLSLHGPAGVILLDLSFALKGGEALCLAGPSGSGKSLTALALLGLLPPGITATGRIRLIGADIIGATEAELQRHRGRTAGLVFQDPATSLDPLMTAGQHVAQSLALHGVPRAQRQGRIAALFAELGLDLALARRHPHRLSGGERQRVAIAIALANDPALLIADEPTTALDGPRADAILDLLTQARRRRGLALLLITHQRALGGRYADATLHLGTPPVAAAPPPRPTHAGRALLEVDGLTVRHVVMGPAHFTLFEGETLGLTGVSGAGKTSLALALFGLIDRGGTVRLAGRDIATLPRRDRARAMQLVMQSPAQSLPPGRLVKETLWEALMLHHPGPESRIAELCRDLDLPLSVLKSRPAALSGGQAQRVALARALLIRPRLLMLDEPTAGLDPAATAALIALLAAERAARGLSLILISHDTDFIAALAHRTLRLADGVLAP